MGTSGGVHDLGSAALELLSSHSPSGHRRAACRVTIDELAAAQGVVPMRSTEVWARDLFESAAYLAILIFIQRAYDLVE